MKVENVTSLALQYLCFQSLPAIWDSVSMRQVGNLCLGKNSLDLHSLEQPLRFDCWLSLLYHIQGRACKKQWAASISRHWHPCKWIQHFTISKINNVWFSVLSKGGCIKLGRLWATPVTGLEKWLPTVWCEFTASCYTINLNMYYKYQITWLSELLAHVSGTRWFPRLSVLQLLEQDHGIPMFFLFHKSELKFSSWQDPDFKAS